MLKIQNGEFQAQPLKFWFFLWSSLVTYPYRLGLHGYISIYVPLSKRFLLKTHATDASCMCLRFVLLWDYDSIMNTISTVCTDKTCTKREYTLSQDWKKPRNYQYLAPIFVSQLPKAAGEDGVGMLLYPCDSGTGFPLWTQQSTKKSSYLATP